MNELAEEGWSLNIQHPNCRCQIPIEPQMVVLSCGKLYAEYPIQKIQAGFDEIKKLPGANYWRVKCGYEGGDYMQMRITIRVKALKLPRFLKNILT